MWIFWHKVPEREKGSEGENESYEGGLPGWKACSHFLDEELDALCRRKGAWMRVRWQVVVRQTA